MAGYLGGGAGKKDDRDGAVPADTLNHLIEVVGDDKTPAYQEIIYSCADGESCELVNFCRIHIVRIYQDGERPLSLFFPGQQRLVNKLLHSLIAVGVSMQKCEKFSALRE